MPLFVATVVVVWATIAVVTSSWWTFSPYDRIAACFILMPAYALPIGAVVLFRWQRSSRPARIMYALGMVWATWVALTASANRWTVVAVVLITLVRPLVFWLVLSWPTGRLRASDVKWLSVYSVASLVSLVTIYLLANQVYGQDNPLQIATLPRLDAIRYATMWRLVMPVGAVVLMVVLARRYRHLPSTARWVARPGLIAGWVFAIGELVLLFTQQYLGAVSQDSTGRMTLVGLVLIGVDWLRFAVVPVVLVAGAAHTRRLGTEFGRSREIDYRPVRSDRRVGESVAGALSDSTARLVFAEGTGVWLDSDGRQVDLGEDGRTTTFIERNGTRIAALEYDGALDVRPATIEAVVATAGAAIDLERVEALAIARREEALAARRALVEVDDATRRRIQRDLHDGAQQGLVGLALRTQLASVDADGADENTSRELEDGIATVRRQLRELVDDGTIAIEGRTLAEAMRELAARVPVAVDVDVDAPADLSDDVRSTAWFVAAEATTNAVKYSEASRLEITGAVADDRLRLAIRDDGTGGATTRRGGGLAGLRERVERFGGRFVVESSPGMGTCVRAEIPIGVAS
ncbi:MAG: sensor histidine kinase [Ilumatobacteraceae bacterium]